jgi:hypothetical protein
MELAVRVTEEASALAPTGVLVTAEGQTWPRGSKNPGHTRTGSLLRGRIAQVSSTREGRLVVRLHTNQGEFEFLAAPWAAVLDAEVAVPTGDLWSYIGSRALISCGRDGHTLVIESIAIR